MASDRQITANKRNASRPRGPLSEAAAAAIRENPLKHGLTAKHVVLSFEDLIGYHELRASIVMEYLPKTPQEHRLADQVAQSYWRLLRSRRVETATFENRLGSLKSRLDIDPNAPIDNDEGISICMSNHAKDFDTLRRYETAIEKAWYRAIRELRAAQKERRQLEAEQAEEEAHNPLLEDTIAERSEVAANAPLIQECTNKPKLSDIGIRCVSKPLNTVTTISERAQTESQECTISGS
jgi:hypothetical protein